MNPHRENWHPDVAAVGSTIWHPPSGIKDARKNTTEKMAAIHNRCLLVVAGAYKETPVEVLHIETMTLPIQEHLEILQAKARSCLKTGGQAAFIRRQCKQVAAKLRKRGVSTLPDTPGRTKHRWAPLIAEEAAYTPSPARPAPWMEESEEYLEQQWKHRASQCQKEKIIKKHFAETWQTKW